MGKKAFVRDEKKARSEKSCPIRKIGEESEEDLVIVISDDEENPAATPVLNMNDVEEEEPQFVEHQLGVPRGDDQTVQ